MRFPAFFSFVVAVLFFSGCATSKIDWNSRAGNYSFDEAIAELGVPDRQATLSDGSIVAEWLQRRGGAYGTTYHSRWSRFHTYDVHEFPDSYLRLIFGPDRLLNRAANFSR